MSQIIPKEQASYNERLFKKGIRRKIHEARFFWLNETLQKLGIKSGKVLELGCFDGRSIEYLPFVPEAYIGYDANWENGLEEGIAKWKDAKQYSFHFCNDVTEFKPSGKFEVCLALETLEHLPLDQLEEYLKKIQLATSGYFLATVPVEKGIPFILKHITKSIFYAIDEPYSLKEVFYAFAGKLQKVRRREFGHKGFDYAELLKIVEKYFIIKEVSGLPFQNLPNNLNLTIGIVAIPRL